MTQDDIIEMARGAAMHEELTGEHFIYEFARLVAAKERESLEAELLKLKKGVAANSDYIQGRWDLIGEFQDIIRARGEK